MIWLAIAAVLVVVVMVGLVVPREVRLYRRASGRRGGVLELDTPEARAAIADPDDWFEPVARRGGHQPSAAGPAPTVPPPKRADALSAAVARRGYARGRDVE